MTNGMPAPGGYVYRGGRPTTSCRSADDPMQQMLDAARDENRRLQRELEITRQAFAALAETITKGESLTQRPEMCSTPWCHTEAKHGSRCWACRKAMQRGTLLERVKRLAASERASA